MTVRELNKKLSKIAPDANLDIIMYSPSTECMKEISLKKINIMIGRKIK